MLMVYIYRSSIYPTISCSETDLGQPLETIQEILDEQNLKTSNDSDSEPIACNMEENQITKSSNESDEEKIEINLVAIPQPDEIHNLEENENFEHKYESNCDISADEFSFVQTQGLFSS